MSWNYPEDLIEAAWGLIANAFDGDWDKASPEWKEAAINWREGYHGLLATLYPKETKSD